MKRKPGAEETEAPPGLILTFLAPAARCNQRCPACFLTEVSGEPVAEFDLSPADFARFFEQVVGGGHSVAGITFQGYEVTLPRSWPYVEAVAEAARSRGVPWSFVTNGMLLAKHVRSIEALDPRRISVSLDGATAAVNDRLRGVSGALETTLSSVRRFSDALPEFTSRLAVVSTLYDEENVASLRQMPRLLRDLGITRWSLGFELVARAGKVGPARPAETLRSWIDELRAIAKEHDVVAHCTDEFGALSKSRPRRGAERGRPADSSRIVRVDPSGSVRVGRELLEVWDEGRVDRWRPNDEHAAEFLSHRLATLAC